MSAVTIRRYRDADEEAVLQLWDRANIGRPWLNLRDEIHEKRKLHRSLFLVAVEGGAIIGTVMGAYDGRRGWIYHLAVAPERRHHGVGRALMDAVEGRMKRLGIKKVNLQIRSDNQEVITFYEHLGYRDERLTSMAKWLRPPPAEPVR